MATEPGTLRIYLGAAPGVGKTYTMLADAQRRRARGTDVVIGLVEPHGRPRTAAMAEGLETVPRRQVTRRGATFYELDVPAVLARRPQVALVDELAHTNADESGHAKRWQDVEDLLAAGIDVITTLNIQHLESLNEVVAGVTGVTQLETIPDAVARRADQIELVDMSPEALRRRMVHGDVYPPDRIDDALTHYFRPGNLNALRELALLWMADRTEEGLRGYREAHEIVAPWETRERIVVGLAGMAQEEKMVHRAARMAQRIPGAELLAVHVVAQDGLKHTDPEALEHLAELVVSLDGGFRRVTGDDVAEELARFAREEQATQLLLGVGSRKHSGAPRLSLAGKVLQTGESVDVHLIGLGDEASHRGRKMARASHAARRRSAQLESAVVRALADGVLEGNADVPSQLEQVRSCLGLHSASVLQQRDDASAPQWAVIASAGERCPETPQDADLTTPWDESAVLAVRGTSSEDPAVQAALTAAVAHMHELRARLTAHRARREEHRHSLRTTLATMQLVLEHELRPQVELARRQLRDTRQPDAGDAPHVARTLASIARHVNDLDDLCRVDTGALDMQLRPIELDDLFAAVVDDLGPGGHRLTIDLPETLPDAIADADALCRAVTVLAADALRRSDTEPEPELRGHRSDGHVALDLRVQKPLAPSGPSRTALPPERSLALRLARGLIEGMAGTVVVKREPQGDGYTTTIELPAARDDEEGTAGRTIDQPNEQGGKR